MAHLEESVDDVSVRRAGGRQRPLWATHFRFAPPTSAVRWNSVMKEPSTSSLPEGGVGGWGGVDASRARAASPRERATMKLELGILGANICRDSGRREEVVVVAVEPAEVGSAAVRKFEVRVLEAPAGADEGPPARREVVKDVTCGVGWGWAGGRAAAAGRRRRGGGGARGGRPHRSVGSTSVRSTAVGWRPSPR